MCKVNKIYSFYTWFFLSFNDNTFLTISDFVDKRFLDNFAFGRLRTSSEDFGLLRKTSDFFGRLRTSLGIFGNDGVVFKNPSTPRIKISRLYLRKSWQVYTDDVSLPRSGHSASDRLKQISHAVQPIRSTTQIWV